MERFVPDVDRIVILQHLLDFEKEHPKLASEHTQMRARFALACTAIGEIPLRDHFDDVGSWAVERSIERTEGSQGRGGHRSDVPIVFHNQDLWGIEDQKTLMAEMKKRLSGVRTKLTYWEERYLQERGVNLSEGEKTT